MKKLNKIFGVGLVVVLLVSLFGLALPASAGTLSWSAETIPGTTDNTLAAVDITDIAVSADGQTIWAVTGTTTAYKSTNGGQTWTAYTITPSATMVAIAPDNTSMVAVASAAASIYVTTNGGSTWSTLGTVGIAASISDIAISSAASGINYVGVSGIDTGAEGNIWYFNIGAAAPSWTQAHLAGWGNASNNGTIATTVRNATALAFSPNFASDRVLVAVTDNSTTNAVQLQMFSTSSKKWNVDAGFTDYPANIISTGITSVTKGSITLAPDYLGSDDSTRTSFIGLVTNSSTADGIYRMADTSMKALKTGVTVNSVAYDGTTLVSGAYSTNAVYYSVDMLASSPTVSTARANKRPGVDVSGNEMVTVAWSGTNVVGGTNGNESAFAISEDNGKTFNDVSLIDTGLDHITDVAPAADGSFVYFTSDNTTDLSVWRKDASTSIWKRILAIPGAVGSGYIVRVAPDNPNSVFVAKKGDTNIYYSPNGGLESWFIRTAGVTIADIAVESADVVYALNATGSVSKSTNAGFIWATSKATNLGTGNMIVSVKKDVLLVGGTTGYVAYSTDGGSTFTKINFIMEAGAGAMQVVADADFSNNNVIYAASITAGTNVRKWTIGSSTSWTDIFTSGAGTGALAALNVGGTAAGCYGLVMGGTTLYALANISGGNSSLWQAPEPLKATSSSTSWNEKAATATVILQATPQALKVSKGSNKLWAVRAISGVADSSNDDELYSFSDTLAGVAATITGPADKFSNKVNNVTGKANEIPFSWSRISTATDYELQISYDSSFTELVTTVPVTSSEATVVQAVGPDRTSPATAQVNWQLGGTYYWRVRATEPLYSAWSVSRTFTVEPGVALVPNILSPVNGTPTTKQKPSFSWSPVSGTTSYRFVLANNPQLTAPIVDITTASTAYALATNLAYGETYYWAVKSLAPVEGGWSAISNFTVMSEPVAPTPPIVVQQTPPPVINIPAAPPAQQIVIPPAPPPPAQIAPAYIWAVIIIGAILVIAVIILIVRTRRTV